METRRCPNCGRWMRAVLGSTQPNNVWTDWECPRCYHKERVHDCDGRKYPHVLREGTMQLGGDRR